MLNAIGNPVYLADRLRRLEGRLQGDFRTLLQGNGTDLLGLRLYEWGDDVRHIDWNVTARMDELYVREFVEDRELRGRAGAGSGLATRGRGSCGRR